MDNFVINASDEELSSAADNDVRYYGVSDESQVWPHTTVPSSFVVSVPQRLPVNGPGLVTLQILLILLVMAAAVLGNLIMCFAVFKSPHLRTVTNIFTINLAVTDLLVSVLILPFWIVSMTTGASLPRGLFPFAKNLCHTVAFLTVLLLLVSVATLAGISLDRYFSISHPLRYPIKVTSRKAYLVLAYIWMQSILLAIAPLFGWGKYTFRPQSVAICNPYWAQSISYAGFMFCLGMVVPFSLMVFSYIRIVQEARKQAQRIEKIQFKLVTPDDEAEQYSSRDELVRNDSTTDLARKSIFQKLQIKRYPTVSYKRSKAYSTIKKNLKTLKTVFIIVGGFFLCWGPYVILNLWAVNDIDRVPYWADFFTTLLIFTNSAVNPLVFIFLTRDFRFAVRMIFARCAHFLGREESLQQLRRESCVGLDSMVDTGRLYSRGSCDSGVDLGQDNRGLTLNEDDGQDNHRLKVPVVACRPRFHIAPEESEIDDSSDQEIDHRMGPSTSGIGATNFMTAAVHIRVEFHEDEPYEDELPLAVNNDSIPLLIIPEKSAK